MKMIKCALFTIMISILFIIPVKADCAITDRRIVQEHAANVKVTYVPTEIQKEREDGELYNQRIIEIKIYNTSPDNMYVLKSSSSNIALVEKHFLAPEKEEDNPVTFTVQSTDMIISFELYIYSNLNECTGELLKTIRFSLPKFNYYSQLEACNGIPEFYLCQEYINFNIDSSKFYSEVNEYQKKKEDPEVENLIINDNTPAQHDIAVIKKSYTKYIIGGIFLVLAIIGTIKLIKKKKAENPMW